MLKTPPAFFTMYLIANIIFPKKTQIIAIWFLINQIAIVFSLSHENEFRNFQFYCCESHFFGGNPRERIFSNSIIHDSNLVGENLPFSFYFGFPRCVF